ncbi:MAG: hypothetical protein K2I10_06380 [Lachnospiraceae bacterium]|nr:hypothetical protein [Lachnospiraceae bacterium]
MNKKDRKLIKDVMQHRDLEMTLSAYSCAYVNRTYEYSLIRLVLNYYTMKEIINEEGENGFDPVLREALDNIHTLVYDMLLSDMEGDQPKAVETVGALRQKITDKMTILTAYTDVLQIYEYVLNRIEYGLTGEKVAVDEGVLAEKVFKYLFKDNDKMVINSKIQMVTGQLPVRMTKKRFFEYLTDTLNIYNGSECSSVDNFTDMLKSSVGLCLPEGFDTAYPDVVNVIKILEDTSFKDLDLPHYKALMEQFSISSDRLTGLVSNYLLVMEIINDLYAVILALPYQMNENQEVKTCILMLKGLHDAFVASGDIPDMVNDSFTVIEGKQEQLGEEIMQFESILYDAMSEHMEMLEDTGIEEIFNALSTIQKLLSNSLFIDLEEEPGTGAMADSAYISEKKDELVKLLTDYFETHSKEVNRAVMGALFSSMPVLFNSQQEIKDYIEYSLFHCSNASELMACAKILEELMEDG